MPTLYSWTIGAWMCGSNTQTKPCFAASALLVAYGIGSVGTVGVGKLPGTGAKLGVSARGVKTARSWAEPFWNAFTFCEPKPTSWLRALSGVRTYSLLL